MIYSKEKPLSVYIFLPNYAKYEKILQTKVVGLKKIYIFFYFWEIWEKINCVIFSCNCNNYQKNRQILLPCNFFVEFPYHDMKLIKS